MRRNGYDAGDKVRQLEGRQRHRTAVTHVPVV